MTFPLLAIEPGGFTWLFESAEGTKRMPIGFIGIYERKKTGLQFFDSGGSVWKLRAIAPRVRIWFWQPIFSGLRRVEVDMQFERCGCFDVETMRQSLSAAVQSDDDILTQFRSRDAILMRLRQAESVSDLFHVYRWMRKEQNA